MNRKLSPTALSILTIVSELVWSAANPPARADVLYSAIPISDSGDDNQIAYPNTGRKVACGPDGTIYVVYYGSSGGVRVARSTDRGGSFHASVQVFATGVEAEIAVDANGIVHVAFVAASNLYYSRSTDAGATFSTPAVVSTLGGALLNLADRTGVESSTVHMDVDTPWVYLIPKSGTTLYRNGESGGGTWTSTTVGSSRSFADVHVDHLSGDVIVGTDNPTVRFLVSTDHGATFGPEQMPGGSVFYSTTVLAVTDAHRYLYVAGNGSTCLRIDVDTATAATLTFGATTISQGRTLAVDAFNNVVDGYVSGNEVKYAISTDNGETFATPVTIAAAEYFSVGLNRYYADIVAIYQTGGHIFCNVYRNELRQAPNVVTATVTGIGASSATCGGEVTSDGGNEVTDRGVCWSTQSNPTLADDHTDHTTDGAGVGTFTSSIGGLSLGITYHVRAYATNSVGTAYGNDLTFQTILQHAVIFLAGAGGSLSGTTTQAVAHGGNTTPVTAVPSTGYGFAGWTGNNFSSLDNPLTITNVTTDLTVTAVFATTDRPVLQVTATADVGGSNVLAATTGDEVALLVVVENVGPVAATGVEISLPLPENLDFVSAALLSDAAALAAPADTHVSDGVLYIGVGDLAAGAQARFELILRANAPGEGKLTAVASAQELDAPAESDPVDVTVADEYYTLVLTPRPGPCGLPGLFPLFTILGLVGLKRRGQSSRSAPAQPVMDQRRLA